MVPLSQLSVPQVDRSRLNASMGLIGLGKGPAWKFKLDFLSVDSAYSGRMLNFVSSI